MKNETMDISKVMSLTAAEIVLISNLGPIANEAERFANMICDTYSFKIGQKAINVSDSNDEILTRDGVWEKSISGQEQPVQIICTYEEIFKVLRDDYLRRQGLISDKNLNAVIAQAFRKFLTKTQARCEGKTIDRQEESFDTDTAYIAEEDFNGTQTRHEMEQQETEIAETQKQSYVQPDNRVASKQINLPGLNQKRVVPGAESTETTEEQTVAEYTHPIYGSFKLLPGAASRQNPDDNPGGRQENRFQTEARH